MGIYLSKNDPFKGVSGLDNLAERISQVLKCPITIEDVNHRLLAYSTHDEETDPARVATIIGRRVPEKVINSLWREGVIPFLLANDKPIRIKAIDEVGLGNRVAIAVRKNQETLGFIWVLEIDYVLKEGDLANLILAAQHVKEYLVNLRLRRNANDEDRQSFFWQLLTTNLVEEGEIAKGFQMLNIQPPLISGVIVFKFSQKINLKLERDINYILRTTQRVEVVLYNFNNNNLILLVSPHTTERPLRDLDNFCRNFISSMGEHFQIGGITGGCGSVLYNCKLISKGYKEALTVLDIKEIFPQETANIYIYQHLGIYRFLPVLAEQRKGDLFENHTIKRISDYDLQHKTQLLKTLEVYLDNDCNVNLAADTLHIHPNTLNYRLRRISEMGEINLNDINQKMAVYIDLKINKFKEQGAL